MKMNKLTMATLALAALGFASTAASAQTVTAGANDLILGFQIASGTGSSTNLEVDLGSYSLFTNTAQLTFNQLSLSDLTTIYGSSWSNTTAGVGVNWSVAGVTPTTNSFYATSLTPIRTTSISGLAGPYNTIFDLPVGLNGQPATANSSAASAIGTTSNPASAITTSYTSLEGGPGATGYGYIPNLEETGAGTDELYSFAPGVRVGGVYPQAVDLGTFTLSNSGVLTFTGSAAAVPEPSAYALGICAILLFIVLRRRHSVV